MPALEQTLSAVPFEPGRPSLIVAHTIKGKGVSYMEHRLAWHYQTPDAAQFDQALCEVG